MTSDSLCNIGDWSDKLVVVGEKVIVKTLGFRVSTVILLMFREVRKRIEIKVSLFSVFIVIGRK